MTKRKKTTDDWILIDTRIAGNNITKAQVDELLEAFEKLVEANGWMACGVFEGPMSEGALERRKKRER